MTPQQGETPTTSISDVKGQLTEYREFKGSTTTGSYDKTAYTYTPTGQLASVTDPAGNVWSFKYDVRGRKIEDSDPDKGDTKYTYNDLDQMTSSTDANGSTVAYTYDSVGRKTGEYAGSTSGTKLAEWTYDTLEMGSPSSSTRWVNGNAYTSRITGYSPQGKPLGTRGHHSRLGRKTCRHVRDEFHLQPGWRGQDLNASRGAGGRPAGRDHELWLR
ncbi:RHS repeat protein [Fodinicola feengrottensis]|uniref:RHS repeat protein n=1 Tax=Fodinicola feengrottensis TaxID=435914 RepID=UPI0013CFC2F6|nr:RHS repeat protein [Fodinicola feengrottensis]